MKHLICILLAASSFSSLLYAQTSTDPKVAARKRIISHIIEEKLRVEPSELQQYIEDLRNNRQRALTTPVEAEEKKGAVLQSNFDDRNVLSNSAEAEIHAAMNPLDSNNMMCSGISQNGGVLSTPVYYTKDFGKTWKKSTALSQPPKINGATIAGGGDPMFAFDANGTAYISWIHLLLNGFDFEKLPMYMQWASSSDGGVTWKHASNDVIAQGFISYTGSTPATLVDKQWMMCDLSSSPYRNNLYCSLLYAPPGDQRVSLRRKVAASDAFDTTDVRPHDDDYTFNQFTSVDVDNKGWVHMSYVATKPSDPENSETMRIYHLVSKDGGASFEKENLVSMVHFLPQDLQGQGNSPEAPVGISRVQILPQISCDKHASSPNVGNVYVAWTANGVTEKLPNGLDIYFSRSTDGGQTWSAPIIVNDDEKGKQIEQAYVSMTVNENGVIVLCWYDRRDDPNNLKAHYYMCFSFDGGRSFSKNFAVTSQVTDFSRYVGQANSFGVGEYNQVLATKGYAIPFWGDGRGGTVRVFTAKVPISSSPTSGVESLNSIDSDINMDAPQPNPADASTRIDYTLQKSMKVRIELCDAKGSLVRLLDESQHNEGKQSITITTSALASGVYYCRVLSATGSIALQKIIVQR